MTHSTAEVVHYSIHGLEAVQPGLEPVYPYYENYGQLTRHDQKPDCAVPVERKLCGLRKVTFWLVTALASLAVIAVGVPVGLGVGLSNTQTSRDTGEPLFLSV
jgi:hypothetical protein